MDRYMESIPAIPEIMGMVKLIPETKAIIYPNSAPAVIITTIESSSLKR